MYINTEASGYGHCRLLDTLFGLAIAWGSLKASVELFERTDFRDPVDICIWCVLKEHIKNVEDLSPSINPLQVACWKGNEDFFESPLAADASACVMVWGLDSPLVRVAFGKLLFYIALNGSKEMLDLLIGHGFDVEAATEVAVPEVQELLLDEGFLWYYGRQNRVQWRHTAKEYPDCMWRSLHHIRKCCPVEW